MTLNIVLSVVVLGALTLAACQAIAPAIPEVPTVPAGARSGDLIDVKACAFQPRGSDTKWTGRPDASRERPFN